MQNPRQNNKDLDTISLPENFGSTQIRRVRLHSWPMDSSKSTAMANYESFVSPDISCDFDLSQDCLYHSEKSMENQTFFPQLQKSQVEDSDAIKTGIQSASKLTHAPSFHALYSALQCVEDNSSSEHNLKLNQRCFAAEANAEIILRQVAAHALSAGSFPQHRQEGEGGASPPSRRAVDGGIDKRLLDPRRCDRALASLQRRLETLGRMCDPIPDPPAGLPPELRCKNWITTSGSLRSARSGCPPRLAGVNRPREISPESRMCDFTPQSTSNL